jgi:hypothetical protein
LKKLKPHTFEHVEYEYYLETLIKPQPNRYYYNNYGQESLSALVHTKEQLDKDKAKAEAEAKRLQDLAKEVKTILTKNSAKKFINIKLVGADAELLPNQNAKKK